MLMALLLIATAQAPAAAPTDAAFCEFLRGSQAQLAPRLPVTIDAVTRLDRLTVNCDERSLTFEKTMLGDAASLAEGWRESHQAYWNETACAGQSFRPAIDRGWQILERFTFSDGSRHDFIARCAPAASP